MSLHNKIAFVVEARRFVRDLRRKKARKRKKIDSEMLENPRKN